MLDSVLVLGSMVRMGLKKTGSRSPSEATPTERTAQAPSERPLRLLQLPLKLSRSANSCSCLDLAKSHEEVAICSASRIRLLFFFIILPWPQRPKNALTPTLTLSGSNFEHLNGGWFRNRFALSCDWCSVLQRALSQSARKAVLLSLLSFSVLCCGQPSRVFRYIC